MTVGLLGIPSALGTEPLIVLLSIAISAAMMWPIMLTSTTSRNSNCPCQEPMQYFGICFRASLSIHSARWIFPFSTFIISCFSGHNTLLFLVVSGFCGLHDTIWPFKASPQPTFGTEQTPALRAFVAARGSLRPTRFLLLYFSPKNRPLFRHDSPTNRLCWPLVLGCPRMSPGPLRGHAAAHRGKHGVFSLPPA